MYIDYSTIPLNLKFKVTEPNPYLNIQENAKYISKILKSYKVYETYNCRLKDLQG